jgi:hypothetical protein
MSLFIVFGILDDFYSQLANVQPTSTKNITNKSLDDYPFSEFVKNVLIEKISDDEQLRDLLAMFGRSLVADVLLHVIAVLNFDHLNDSDPVEFRRLALAEIEQLTHDLISNHSARMDELGMSA